MHGQRRTTHLFRQGAKRMREYNQEAGKGLYIGRDRVNSNLDQQHGDITTTSDAATTATRWRPWWSHFSDGGMSEPNSGSQGRGQSVVGHGLPNTGHQSQHNIISHPGEPSSFLSSTSSPSSYVKQHAPSYPLSNTITPKPSSSLSNSAHSSQTTLRPAHSHHQGSNRGLHIPSLPAKSSSSLSHKNLVNLGNNYVSSINSLHHHPPHGTPFDPLPTAWDVNFNQSNSLCLNRTIGNYDCWDLFNPDENDTTTPATGTFAEEEYRFWTLVLIIIPILTVFGNILVVLSVIKEKSLKTVTNYFICSLAVADIMVAVIVMPFAIYMEIPEIMLLTT